MIKAIIFDFSKVLLFTNDPTYEGQLNELHRRLNGPSNYNFSDYFRFNNKLIDLVNKELIQKYDIYMFTSGTIQEASDCQRAIKGMFRDIFSAEKMDLKKNDEKAYTELSQKINIPPNEILYVDDSIDNITAAKNAGMAVIIYTDFDSFESELEKVLDQ